MTPIVLVPGLLCSAEVFAPQVAALWPFGPVTIASTLDCRTVPEMAAAVLATAPPRFALAGISMGGYISFEIMRQAPERVRGLAFVCSKPQPDAAANLTRRAATIAQARAGSSAALLDGMAQNLIGATARERHPEIVTELRARMTLTPEAFVAVQAGLATRPDSVPTVATITAPILAIAGGEDTGIAPAEMEAFRAAPGGCEFHLLPDAGHFAAYEQPRKVAALMAAWLRQFAQQ